MTQSQLYAILGAVGPQVAYLAFKRKISPPFIIYGMGGDSDVSADNDHYFEIADGFIEFYSDEKDPETEKAVQKALSDNGIPWSREAETYIPDQRMLYVRWSIQLIGG